MWWTVVIRYVRVSVFSLCMRGLSIIILNTGSTNMYVLCTVYMDNYVCCGGHIIATRQLVTGVGSKCESRWWLRKVNCDRVD